ncbi:MAG: hypothetical protein CL609_05725 [Anaerolineaceae bacterium]|nr:hypothetical protein [Anaerolineaceae bacterium]
MNITTPRLLIREFHLNDLDTFLSYEKQKEMRQFEKGIVDREAALEYLNRAVQDSCNTPRTYYKLAITVPPEDKVIGRISLASQNPEIREWEIGWTVRVEDWGKGYASEAAYQMLEFAFIQLNAHRVVAFCHAKNTASINVMKKIGMKQEGHLRQTRWFNNSWADEFVYAILETDFFQGER